jgi:hypothetical protein
MSLCDDCCCGTERKHPGVDHEGIRRRLAAAASAAGGRSRVVRCVGACGWSNVVVVRAPRFTVWVGGVLGGAIVDELAEWISAGAPSPPPSIIRRHVFDRSGDPVGVTEPVVIRSKAIG